MILIKIIKRILHIIISIFILIYGFTLQFFEYILTGRSVLGSWTDTHMNKIIDKFDEFFGVEF